MILSQASKFQTVLQIVPLLLTPNCLFDKVRCKQLQQFEIPSLDCLTFLSFAQRPRFTINSRYFSHAQPVRSRHASIRGSKSRVDSLEMWMENFVSRWISQGLFHDLVVLQNNLLDVINYLIKLQHFLLLKGIIKTLHTIIVWGFQSVRAGSSAHPVHHLNIFPPACLTTRTKCQR